MTPVRPVAVGWSKDRHTTHRRGFSSFMAVGWSKRVLSLKKGLACASLALCLGVLTRAVFHVKRQAIGE